MSITVEDIVSRLSEAFHLQPSACEDRQEDCQCYVLSPEFGQGEFRFFWANRDVGLLVFDFLPSQEMSVWNLLRDDLCICFYKSVDADRIIQGEARPISAETIYTNVGSGHFDEVRFHCGGRANGFVMILDPENAFPHHQVVRSQFSVDSLERMNALSGVPEILPILRQIENCPIRETTNMRSVYYTAKIYELLALCTAAAHDQCRAVVAEQKVSAEDRESIAALTRYIDEHLSGEIDQTALANRVHMSKSKLKYTFKAVTGMTMTEYCSQRREGRACELLRQTQLPISDIAVELGFSSTSSFSRFFKMRLRVTPMDYRQSCQIAYA